MNPFESAIFSDNQLIKGNLDNFVEVKNPFTKEVLTKINLASNEQINNVVSKAVEAKKTFKKLSAGQKTDLLEKLIGKLHEHYDDFTNIIVAEAGKPISYAKAEMDRCIKTLSFSKAEALNSFGETVNIDFANGEGKKAFTLAEPAGILLAITPFNFPLNLALHKIGPAIAAGCPIIWKPALKTPKTALLFASILKEINFPNNLLQIVICDNEKAQNLVENEQINLLSFTGSDKVGWHLKSLAGKKKVFLELGGNAAVIIDENTNLPEIVNKVVLGAFLYAGQICISTQRILVHQKIYGTFKTKILEAIRQIKVGSPTDKETICGPLIDTDSLKRIDTWVAEAKQLGAKVLAGGKVISEAENLYAPTLLEQVDKSTEIYAEEAFAPVAILESFRNYNEAIEKANDSKYGLQIGVFTENMQFFKKAINEIESGAVIFNDIPGFRVDNMPYGGIKDSGLGREGVRYAIKEFTEQKLIIF
jgi:acyl-CoA reductase-like NAD-dependent aldehyde dehydrogenase